jgi:tRNA(Ile)-lysidine synthase
VLAIRDRKAEDAGCQHRFHGLFGRAMLGNQLPSLMYRNPSICLNKLSVAWPARRWSDVTVLVGASGGADSIALVRALCELRTAGEGRLVVAHFNHRLRGAESDADQQFVAELARQLGLECMVGAAEDNLAAGGSGEGIEGAARQARYEFLAAVAGQCGARYVATAHTADDQVETVLHNILRGTGLAGLAGIPRYRRLPNSATIIRPLLDVTRAEVLDYLRAIHQPYRDDSTNQLDEFTRNRIRLQLLPQLERDYNPHVREALLRLSQIASRADDCFQRQADALFDRAVKQVTGGVAIDLPAIRDAHPAVVRQLLQSIWQRHGWPLQDMNYDKWCEVVSLLSACNTQAPRVFPGNIRAEQRGDKLRFIRT